MNDRHKYNEQYKGHAITVDTFKRGKGFGWSYQIDGGEPREIRERSLGHERIARGEALDRARSEIDGMGEK